MGSKNEQTVGVIGFASSLGQPRGGTEQGPRALREGGIVDEIKALGLNVIDHGDVVSDNPIPGERTGTMKNPTGVSICNKKFSDAVEKHVRNGETVLTLGGDHSMAIGSLHGHAQAQPDMVIVWVDAHADINTPLTSGSGNIHGMPVSFVVKELVPYMPEMKEFDWIKPSISVKDLVYIGLRDVDPGERAIIEKFGIPCYSMQEVDKFGIKTVIEMALNQVDPSGNRPIHVSFDVDAMDPEAAPSTGTPVPGGLSLRESFFIAEEICKTGRLSVLDIAEVNPLLGNEEQQKLTVKNSVDLATRFFGKQRQGNTPALFEIPKP